MSEEKTLHSRSEETNLIANSTEAESPLAGGIAGISRALARTMVGLVRAGSGTISGTVAGLAEETAGFPLDTVKTRMQVQSTGHGTMQVLRNIIKNEGPGALFSGLASPVLGAAIFNAILFGTYENSLGFMTKHFHKSETEKEPVLFHFYAGALGGLAQSIITCPVDAVKNKMQVMGLGGHGQTSNVSTFSVAKSIWKQQGIRGMYLGMVPTIIRDTPGYGVYFFVYDYFKRNLNHQLDNLFSNSSTTPQTTVKSEHGGGGHGEGSFLAVVLSGGCAGTLYHLSTYPFDLVKSIIQTQPIKEEIIKNSITGKEETILIPTYKNMRHCFASVYEKEGIKGLFRGLTPTLIRAFPASAVGFLAYELTLKFLPN